MRHDPEERPEPPQALLTVDLQEGFDDDTVIIRLNGQEVYREDRVATMRLLGLADTFSTDVKPGRATLEVEVPSRNLMETFPLQVTGNAYVGLSLVEGKLEAIWSDQAFGYA